jgi:cbb3-type cytochrome oxidase subunit 3
MFVCVYVFVCFFFCFFLGLWYVWMWEGKGEQEGDYSAMGTVSVGRKE